MAPFNPPVPVTQDPNYLGYAKVVDAPPPNTSVAKAITTAGDAFAGAAELGDKWVKADISEDLHKQVDTQRDAYTSALETARTVQKNGLSPSGSPQGSLLGYAESDASTAPPSLDAGLSGIDALTQARTSGKINDTYYTQQLNTIAKNMRTQYPGYRDFIDQKISQYTGMDPANAYYKNIMEDINRDAQKGKTDQDKTLTRLYQNIEIPGILPYINAVKAGIPDAQSKAEEFLNNSLSDKYKFDANERARTTKNQNKEDAATDAKQDFSSEFYKTANRVFNTTVSLTGMNEPITLSKILTDQNTGKIHLTDEQNTQLQQVLVDQRRQLAQYGVQLANKRDYANKIGDPKAVNGIINEQLAIFDQAIEGFKNKDTGVAFGSLRRAEAIQNDEAVKLLSDPTVGGFTRMTQAMTKFAGPNWVNSTMSTGLTNDMAPKYQQYVQEKIMNSQLPDDVRKDGKIKALYDDVADAQTKGIAPKTKVYDNLFENINNIKNPNAPDNVKKEIVQYAFAPKNWGIMDQFKQDYTDQNGHTVPGKYSVFSRMTSPDITNAVWNLHDPKSWENYKNWGEQSFKTLYGNEIQNLNALQGDRSLPVTIHWDADNFRFSAVGPDNLPLKNPTGDVVGQNQINAVNSSLNRLNSGLSSLAKIQDKDRSQDPSTYLLKTMMTLGFRPGEKVTGIPQQMMDAIANSQKSTAKRFEDTFSR